MRQTSEHESPAPVASREDDPTGEFGAGILRAFTADLKGTVARPASRAFLLCPSHQPAFDPPNQDLLLFNMPCGFENRFEASEKPVRRLNRIGENLNGC
jgi:hypothetical protein